MEYARATISSPRTTTAPKGRSPARSPLRDSSMARAMNFASSVLIAILPSDSHYKREPGRSQIDLALGETAGALIILTLSNEPVEKRDFERGVSFLVWCLQAV